MKKSKIFLLILPLLLLIVGIIIINQLLKTPVASENTPTNSSTTKVYKTNDILTAGTYIYGKDIKKGRYMYNFSGTGSIVIKSGDQEVFFKEITKESVHFMGLPLKENETIILSGDVEFELV